MLQGNAIFTSFETLTPHERGRMEKGVRNLKSGDHFPIKSLAQHADFNYN